MKKPFKQVSWLHPSFCYWYGPMDDNSRFNRYFFYKFKKVTTIFRSFKIFKFSKTVKFTYENL